MAALSLTAQHGSVGWLFRSILTTLRHVARSSCGSVGCGVYQTSQTSKLYTERSEVAGQSDVRARVLAAEARKGVWTLGSWEIWQMS